MLNLTAQTRNLRSRGLAVTGMLGLIAALGAAAVLRPGLESAKSYQAAFEMTDKMNEELNASPIALIMGEMRASLADLMWVKTERYLHRGVAFQPHLDSDAMTRNGAVKDQPKNDHGDGHAREETLIPGADADYRGFIGTLHRAVQPWQGPEAPHEHSAGDELIPWYRLLTYSNPHHWRGYMIGTWWLLQQEREKPGAIDEAADFIAEGVANNPDVFQLKLLQGRILLQRERLSEAIECFRLAGKLGLKVRPKGGNPAPPTWTESDEEDFRMALRYVPMLLARKLNDWPAAKRELDLAIQLVPDDKPLKKLQKEYLDSGIAN